MVLFSFLLLFSFLTWKKMTKDFLWASFILFSFPSHDTSILDLPHWPLAIFIVIYFLNLFLFTYFRLTGKLRGQDERLLRVPHPASPRANTLHNHSTIAPVGKWTSVQHRYLNCWLFLRLPRFSHCCASPSWESTQAPCTTFSCKLNPVSLPVCHVFLAPCFCH